MSICHGCGQLTGIPEYDAGLWDLYDRRKDGRQYGEALVFTSDWLQENIVDEEDEQVLDLTMSKDMASRGLCHVCARPNLQGFREDDFLSEEDARDQWEMEAERAAERRMGA